MKKVYGIRYKGIRQILYTLYPIPYSLYLLLLIPLLPYTSIPLSAQQWIMPVEGKVMVGVQKAAGAVITLYKNGQQQSQVVTTSNGKFSFELPPNADFIISITKPGYVTKKFKIVTANVPADRAEGGNFNPFEPDVTLFEMPTAPEIAKRVEAILSQPIAIYQYIPSENNFNYDEKYTQSIQQKLAELADLQKQVEKQMEEKAKNAAVEAQKQLELDNKYKAAIAKGDKAFNSTDYPLAKAGYNEALGIKPGEAYPKQKLSEIDKLLANANAQKEIDAKYKAAITKGDGQFGAKDYAEAKTAYTEASGIKPSEQYPKTKLAEIEKLIADAAKQKETDEKYKAAIAKADGAFGSKDYTTAKTAYTDASYIKPAEQYPKQKITEIDKLLADASKQKEIDEKYKTAITKGDGAFNSKEYASAKTAYTEATGIKPSEQYPKTKLAELEKLLGDAAKQKEIDTKYQAAITKGDNAFKAKEYATAKAGFNEALGIKPNEPYPKQMLVEIDKLVADAANAAKQKEMDEKYKAAIAKGDGAFSSKDFVTARTGYTEATGIKPSEQYPKTKLAEIDKLLGDAAKQKEIESKYQAAITKGDNAFNSKDYSTAKAGYTEASGIKPSEQYPKTKLAEIEKLIADAASAAKQKEIDDKYKAAISKGDGAFVTKDYATARGGYTEASGIKPSEQYPKTKLAEIDKLLGAAEAEKLKEQQYKDAIAKADAAFGTKDYAGAKKSYTQALTIKPAEQYPKQKIAEIDKLLADLAAQKSAAEKDKQYNDAIAKADKLFTAKDYSNSKSAYNEALGVKPAEQYPKSKIAEIDKLLADLDAQKSAAAKQKEIDDKYKAAIAKGDAALGSKNYTTARSGYTEATGIKPSEQYPKTKLAEIDKLLADLASQKSASEKEQQYKDAIVRGDKGFTAKDYTNAKSAYQEASGMKPNETYPKNKIEEIDKILADIASKNASDKTLNENYLAAVTRGDYAFNGKTYANAKAAYNEALTYKPNEQYPKDKLAEIEKIEKDRSAAQVQQEKDQKYNLAIGKADNLFKLKNYNSSKSSYEEALSIKPDEQYPKDRIKLIDDIIKKSLLAQNIKKEPKQTAPVVSEEEKKKIYQSELRSKYPNGITEEEFTDNGKTVLRRVVIKDDFAGVYSKVTHNWGGVYCFRDNVPITEVTFENETK